MSTTKPSTLFTAALTSTELKDLLKPETSLEASFLEDAEFCRGLQWGVPRYGHPEGTIMAHIIEVNANIDRLPVDAETRRLLRIVCWVHDTFKHIEDKGSPRDWTKHHGVYARNFLARHYDDPLLLNLVEMHDDAYYAWRLEHLYHRLAESVERITALREAVGEYWQLFYLFFKCDTSTGDKNPAPLVWFEETMEDIQITEFLGETV
ncbi:MAG: hypothetical protein AB8H12_16845 [Lewinella sp.]